MQTGENQFLASCECDSVRCDHRDAARHDVSQALLRASLQDKNDGRNRFIPLNQLRSEFDFDKIKGLLRRLFGDGELSSDEIADQISPRTGSCPCCEDDGSRPCTGRRITFISLVQLAKENLIHDIIGLTPPKCDTTLPRRPARSVEPNGETETDRAEGQLVGITGLEPDEDDLFYHLQWQMRSPYFTAQRSTSVDCRLLDEEVSLPWTEVAKLGENVPDDLEYATVQKIRIHRSHHDLGPEDEFALKVFDPVMLRGSAEKAFENETNFRISHPHITKLLTAFEHRTKFHIIWPFAQGGNLQQLWEDHPNPTMSPERSIRWYSEEWLIQQCYGVADALAKVHGHPSLLQPRGIFQKPKLHQDIKPENILCFREGSSYTLKLADFGHSRELDPGKTFPKEVAKGCLTYRPPEANVAGSWIGHSWDIWCLGCVFLEFVTWAIEGRSGVEDFGEKRFSEEEMFPQDQEDLFFLKPNPRRILRCFATQKIKESVTSHMRDLRNNKKCSDKLKGFLQYIEEHMLVIKSDKRAKSPEVSKYLKDLADQLPESTSKRQSLTRHSESAPLLEDD